MGLTAGQIDHKSSSMNTFPNDLGTIIYIFAYNPS